MPKCKRISCGQRYIDGPHTGHEMMCPSCSKELFGEPAVKHDTRKWAWCEQNSDTASDKFDTQDDAIIDAFNTMLDDDIERATILIARVNPVVPSDVIMEVTDLDGTLEIMSEYVYDNIGLDRDDLIDVAGDYAEAERALKTMLSAWASKYLHSTCWCMDDNAQVIRYVKGCELADLLREVQE